MSFTAKDFLSMLEKESGKPIFIYDLETRKSIDPDKINEHTGEYGVRTSDDDLTGSIVGNLLVVVTETTSYIHYRGKLKGEYTIRSGRLI